MHTLLLRRLPLRTNGEQSTASGEQNGVGQTELAIRAPQASPDLVRLLRVWLALGAQSFGGGVATLALIRQAAVERHGWLTEDEFTRDWALVQIAPGINLIAMTVLIGRRAAGGRGIVICLAGLLLPSAAITVLLTASYAHIQRLPLMQSALRGIVPATVGLGLVTAAQMARPILAANRKDGPLSLLAGVALLVASGLTVLRWRVSVVPVLCAAGAVGALVHILHERLNPPKPQAALLPADLACDAPDQLPDEINGEKNRDQNPNSEKQRGNQP